MKDVIKPADSDSRDCLICGEPSKVVMTFRGCPTCGTEVTLCDRCFKLFRDEMQKVK